MYMCTLREMNGCRHVYVIGAHDGTVKVGISIRPAGRIHDIETASGKKVVNSWFTGLTDNACSIESEAKKHFQNQRICGEWFSCGYDEMKKFVEQEYNQNPVLKIQRSRHGTYPEHQG